MPHIYYKYALYGTIHPIKEPRKPQSDKIFYKNNQKICLHEKKFVTLHSELWRILKKRPGMMRRDVI